MTQAHLLLIALFAVILYCRTKKDKDVKDIRGVEEKLGWSSWSFCRIGGELKGTCSEPAEPAHINKKFTRDEVFGDEATTEFATLMHQQQKSDMFDTVHLSEIASLPLSAKKMPPPWQRRFRADAERTELPPLPKPLGYVPILDPNASKRPPLLLPAKPTVAKSVGPMCLTINMEKHLCHLKAQILCASAAPRTRWALVEELMKSVGTFLGPISLLEEAVEVIRHRALPMLL